MKQEWRIHGEKADFQALSERLQVSPYTVRIMCNRKLKTYEEMEGFLFGNASRLHSPLLLPDCKKAVDILKQKIQEKKKLRIIGDYDIDGVSSIAVLYRALIGLGLEPEIQLDWRVPHRILDGFGLNEGLIREAAADGVDTVITCDNGIAAGAEVKLAAELGLTVIITDHHEVPENGGALPWARAAVDPKRPDSTYPWKHLCGAAVSYKLMQALYQEIPDRKPEELEDLLELVAMATVGDVVDLQDENRILVQLGLQRMKQTHFPGIAALLEQYQVNPMQLKSYTIGFQIGPALNAGGRLETAKLAVQLLLADELTEAKALAVKLYELNMQRREMTDQGVQQAQEIIEKQGLQRYPVLVVYLPDCHESVAGIIAGRLREQYYQPTFVITKAAEGLKGSGRSIEGYDMFHELERVQHLFTKFGGHEMAAGLSLAEENLPAMTQQLNAICTLTPKQLTPRIWIDIALPVERVTPEFVRELERLEPFGKGNEAPVFAEKNLRLDRISFIGRDQNQGLRLLLQTETGYHFVATYWGEVEQFRKELVSAAGKAAWQRLIGIQQSGNNNETFAAGTGPVKMMMIYAPSLRSYRGEEQLQIRIKQYQFQ